MKLKRLRETSGHAWGVIRKRILRRDCGLYQLCQKRDRLSLATEVDHIVALINGGTDDDDNLQSLCRDCHVMKTRADKGFKPSGACDEFGFPIDPRHHAYRG